MRIIEKSVRRDIENALNRRWENGGEDAMHRVSHIQLTSREFDAAIREFNIPPHLMRYGQFRMAWHPPLSASYIKLDPVTSSMTATCWQFDVVCEGVRYG